MQETLNRIEEQRKLLEGNGEELRARWVALIEPLGRPELTPAALREWLSRHERLLENYADLDGLRREHEGVANDLFRARTLLDLALAACGLAGCADDDTLSNTLTRAQQAVSAARQVKADREAIEQQIESTKGELDDVEHQRHQYGFFRATIERVIQDLVFNGVIQRYRDWIQVGNLEEVVGFESAEYKEIARLYKRCCDVVDAHDPASAKNAPVPSPQELDGDLSALKVVIGLIRARRAKAKQVPAPGAAPVTP